MHILEHARKIILIISFCIVQCAEFSQTEPALCNTQVEASIGYSHSDCVVMNIVPSQ